MMTIWRFWLHTFIWSSQYNPPRFVETLMLLIAIALLTIWQITPNWPYLALSLSYIIGASISILVREAIAPSPQMRTTQVTAVLLLIISIYGFIDLIQYL